jgi:hypothetical protein
MWIEPRSLVGSPLGGLEESFPEGYFAAISTRFTVAAAKYRATAKSKATRARREALPANRERERLRERARRRVAR